MNKENKFPHLEEWCAKYYNNVGLKVHPSNVPADVILDELLGKVDSLRSYFDNLVAIYNNANKRITDIEENLEEIEKYLSHSAPLVKPIVSEPEEKKSKVKK